MQLMPLGLCASASMLLRRMSSTSCSACLQLSLLKLLLRSQLLCLHSSQVAAAAALGWSPCAQMAQHWQLSVGSTCGSSLYRSAALFVQALSRLHARESSRGAQALSHRSYHAESTIFLVSPCPFRDAVEVVSGTPQHVLLVLNVWHNQVQPSHLGSRSFPDGCAVLWKQCHALCCCGVFCSSCQCFNAAGEPSAAWHPVR